MTYLLTGTSIMTNFLDLWPNKLKLPFVAQSIAHSTQNHAGLVVRHSCRTETSRHMDKLELI